LNKKQKKEMLDMASVEEDISNMSEQSFDRDIEMSNSPNYASDEVPTDMYRYKRMRLVPDSQAEFKGVLDKDVVLANVQNKRPDPDYLRYIAETIVAMDVFSKKQTIFKFNDKHERIPILNNMGKVTGYQTLEIDVPDEEFDIIRDFLRGSFKADLTLSRAMGDQREAILDRTQNFGKEIKKSDNRNKYSG
jgi:hypothetical protein